MITRLLTYIYTEIKSVSSINLSISILDINTLLKVRSLYNMYIKTIRGIYITKIYTSIKKRLLEHKNALNNKKHNNNN